MREMKLRITTQNGLTLFELLIVLSILALLATLVAPRVVGYLGRAKADIALANAANIAASLELFYLDYGRYPSNDEGLSILHTKSSLDDPFWRGPYVKDDADFHDPWGRPFEYNASGDTFTVTSFGRDGSAGGNGEDADIIKK